MTIEFLTQPIIERTKEDTHGITQVFKDPVPLAHQRNFKFAKVYHQPKFQSITIFPLDGQKIDESSLLKIANSFGASHAKIKEWFQGNFGIGENRNRKRVKYSITYGPKNHEWDEAGEILKTIENNLEYEPVLCYGITRYDVNHIIHNEPILQ